MSLSLLSERIKLLTELQAYLKSDSETLTDIYHRAEIQNYWFTQENIQLAVNNIIHYFLDEKALSQWATHYHLPEKSPTAPHKVGIIMAGNIPLVGFHDVLCTFIVGHQAQMKLSSKDSVIWSHLVQWLSAQHPEAADYFVIKEQIPQCDAYIATGSNNTSRYFESFFEKYPHIIRKNRSSVAILSEQDDLSLLTHDVMSFFGLGCRNVAKVYLPEGYDLQRILEAFKDMEVLKYHHAYHNNFDYHLAIYLLNKVPILYNEQIILVENTEVHAPVSVLHYEWYSAEKKNELVHHLLNNDEIQCISGTGFMEKSDRLVPLGQTQEPSLYQYPDAVDTMKFLLDLK